jgi:hypothetical protein
MRTIRSCVAAAFAVVVVGCAATPPGPHSERVLDDQDVATLTEGLTRADLVQRIGPPAQDSGYRRLNETVASWRLLEPGGRRMLLNAHFDPSGHVKYYSRSLDPSGIGDDAT